MDIAPSKADKPLKPEDETWVKNMVRETFRDLREMVDKWERNRLNQDFFEKVESEIRIQIAPFLDQHQRQLVIRSIILERELYFSGCLWGVIFLKSLDKILDEHIYDLINAVVDSNLNLKQKLYVLDFMLKKIDREIDQEKADMIEIYKRIIMIQPRHIKNRAAVQQVLNNDHELELSLDIEAPDFEDRTPHITGLQALEILSQDLDHSLIFMTEDETPELVQEVRPEKPSDMEISIDAILPEEIKKEAAEELAQEESPEVHYNSLNSAPKPIWGARQRQHNKKRMPIDDAIELTQKRQRSYPSHEHTQRTPHLKTE